MSEPINLFAISNKYGNPDQFKKLIDTAHEFGISVLFNIVLE